MLLVRILVLIPLLTLRDLCRLGIGRSRLYLQGSFDDGGPRGWHCPRDRPH